MRHMIAVFCLSMPILTGCGTEQSPPGTALVATGPATNSTLPRASGGLRGALLAECGIDVPDADGLITIANARLGPDSAGTAERFCAMAAAQHPLGATGMAQTITVALSDGASVTVNRTTS